MWTLYHVDIEYGILVVWGTLTIELDQYMAKEKKGVEDTIEEEAQEEETEETTPQGGREAGRPKLPLMSILSSDGTLRLVVPEGTEGAVYREFETSDGKKGSKWELVFKSLAGKITNIEEYEGDYGVSLLVTFTYDGGEDIVAFNTGTPFGEDFMKKLPNINLDEYVTIQPYAFTDDGGKMRKGVSIKQGDEKLTDFFTKKEGEKFVHLHGFPEPKGDTNKYSKDKWKIYFLECREWLLEYTRENFISLFADPGTSETKADGSF